MTSLRFWFTFWLVWVLAGCTALPPSPDTPSSADATLPVAAQAPTHPATEEAQAPPRKTPQIPAGPLQQLNTPAPAQAQQVAALEAPKDLWERIRRSFAMPNLESELVREQEQWYLNRPDYLQRMTERASKYLFHIVEEIELRGLPMELALLPFIESAFNPQAVSSVRAAGIWQFMPATGKSFDLTQNAFRDDRRDVLASTRAALDYLEQLHTRFGDWHLALAAYNWGQGNVGRAITRNQRDGKSTAYTELSMPKETRWYVPKLQAIKNLVDDPERFQTALPLIGNHPFFDAVPIDRDMDVALIARLAQVNEKDFRQLNPSVHQPVIMAAGTPTILLPWDNAAIFTRNLHSHTGPLTNWTVWKVPRTMSTADAARLHDMTENELRDINRIPPRMQIRAGSTLVVPRNGKQQKDIPSHVAENGQILLTPESQLRRVTLRAGKGDTLVTLAKRNDISASNLAQWNRLNLNAALRVGQKLIAYLPAKDRTGVKSKKTSRSTTSAQQRRKKSARNP